MKRSPAFINSLLFFILLATPFSYILSYFKRGTIFFGFNFPTAMQSVTALTNPQYAATVVLILLVMVILQNKSLTVRNKLIVYLSVFLAFGFKFYGGVVLTFLVFIETILRFRSLLRFQLRKGTARFWLARMTNLFKPIALLGIMIALSLLVFYDPFSSAKSGSIFVWSPLSTVHPLIEDPDAIYMQTLVQARYFLYENNIFSPRLWTIELFTIGLYFVFNTGTRIIGLVYLAKSLLQRKITQFNLTILLTAIFSFLLSILLIQKGEWWNTVQFFGYSLLLFNFFSAESIEQIWRSKFRIKYFIIGLVIILTVPLSFELLLRQYQRFKAPGEILIQESRALKYLEKQPDGIILQLPIPKTSYVSAFTGKRSYYADEQILKNLGVNFEDRKKELDKTVEINFKKIPIRYIYLLKISPERDTLVEKISQSKKYRRVFENDEVMIYNRQ